MPLPLSALLQHPDLGIRVVTGEKAALAAPVTWVSSSDLADPTPFLVRQQVLLTTGSQFPRERGEAADGEREAPGRIDRAEEPAEGTRARTDYDPYVRRLAEAGVTALGFGTEVFLHRMPAGLILACQRYGLPLFEVPYRTPFIAAIRYAADTIAAAEHARELWAMNAQRAISFAALRPHPLPAVLGELARLLGNWVALYAAPGPTVSLYGRSEAAPEAIALEAERLLTRGQRSAATLRAGGEAVSLQTIGRRGDLRGVLVIGGEGELDAADHSVITSVVALAGLALEQGRGLRRARRSLRAGLFEVMLSGKTSLSRRALQQIHEVLPAEPLRVAVWQPAHGAGDPLLRELDERTQQRPGSVFFATHGREIVALLPAEDALERAIDLSRPGGLTAGLSDPLGYPALEAGLEQARRALEAVETDGAGGPGEPTVSEFSAARTRDLIDLVAGPDAAEIAGAILSPVLAYDREHGTRLLESLAAWLEHNGQWDPAARTLGLHRHTLKARITQVEALTGENLATMSARTNLWLALRARRDGRA